MSLHLYAIVSRFSNRIQASLPSRHEITTFALTLLDSAHNPKDIYPINSEDLYVLIGENLNEGDYNTLKENPNWAQTILEAQKKRTAEGEPAHPEWGRVWFFPAKELNPHKRDWKTIPLGDYCYVGRERRPEEPETKEDGRPIHYITCCPYWTSKNFNGVDVPWCSFLETGGLYGAVEGDHTPERHESDHQKLLAHFGSEEAIDKALPLFLLFDQVKECGVNIGDEDFGCVNYQIGR